MEKTAFSPPEGAASISKTFCRQLCGYIACPRLALSKVLPSEEGQQDHVRRGTLGERQSHARRSPGAGREEEAPGHTTPRVRSASTHQRARLTCTLTPSKKPLDVDSTERLLGWGWLGALGTGGGSKNKLSPPQTSPTDKVSIATDIATG